MLLGAPSTCDSVKGSNGAATPPLATWHPVPTRQARSTTQQGSAINVTTSEASSPRRPWGLKERGPGRIPGRLAGRLQFVGSPENFAHLLLGPAFRYGHLVKRPGEPQPFKFREAAGKLLGLGDSRSGGGCSLRAEPVGPLQQHDLSRREGHGTASHGSGSDPSVAAAI